MRRSNHISYHHGRYNMRLAPSPLPVLPLYSRESDDSEVKNYHMPARLFNPRKRLHLEQRLPQESSQLPSKKQKLNHPRGSQPPAEFWDNLSKIWLTERALKELDRRNTQPSPSSRRSQYQRSRRPVTRSAVAKWKNKWEPTQPAADSSARHSAEDIKLLARHGGLDLSDIRGYRKPLNPLYCIMSSSKSSSRGRKRNSKFPLNTNTTTTRNTRPYDRNFQQNLIDDGVYPYRYEYPDGRIPTKPNNWEEVNQRLAQPRPSLSPSKFSKEAHEKFVRADAHASKEKQVMELVIPIIEGEIKDAKCVSGGIPLTNLDHLTDGTLVPGNPDRYYGSRPEQLSRQIRTELSYYIIPSTQHDLPIVPNFLLAAKGPDGSIAVAGRQASYDGALGARGMHRLQSYGQDEAAYENNASTITSIYHGGQLKMYTSHCTQPNGPGSRPEYYMTQLNTWGMTGNVETFRDGARAFRNARDWAKEQRDEAIRQANERVNETPSTTPTCSASVANLTTEVSSLVAAASLVASDSQSQDSLSTKIAASNTSKPPHQDSDTSEDELATDLKPPAKRSKSGRSRCRKRDTGASRDPQSNTTAGAVIIRK